MRVTVFCGSRSGADPRFEAAARELGAGLAARGHGVVYGGASVGLMGALADAALEAGGEVIGVIPESLVEREIAHAHLTEQRVVSSMHQRKNEMMQLGDRFVALPGGVGTLEEWFEAFTWQVLGLHEMPCALLDLGGYYQPLLRFLEGADAAGFLGAGLMGRIEVYSSVGEYLDGLR